MLHMDRIIFQEGEGAERITVLRTTDAWTNRAVLELRLLRQRAAAQYIDDGEPAYRYLVHWRHLAHLVPSTTEKILLLGGGAGVAVTAMYEMFPKAHFTVVEPDGRLQALAERYFSCPTERVTWHTMTAEAFIEQDKGPRYGLILFDVFEPTLVGDDGGVVPESVHDQRFLHKLMDRMLQRGMLLQNYIATWNELRGDLRSLVQRYKKTGLTITPCFMTRLNRPGERQNIVLVGERRPEIALKRRLLAHGLTDTAQSIFEEWS